MVNMEAGVPGPTARAPVPVTFKHRFTVSAEVIPRVPAHPITLRAEAGDDEDSFAAGSKQRLLPETSLGPSPQESFLIAGEG